MGSEIYHYQYNTSRTINGHRVGMGGGGGGGGGVRGTFLLYSVVSTTSFGGLMQKNGHFQSSIFIVLQRSKK